MKSSSLSTTCFKNTELRRSLQPGNILQLFKYTSKRWKKKNSEQGKKKGEGNMGHNSKKRGKMISKIKRSKF